MPPRDALDAPSESSHPPLRGDHLWTECRPWRERCRCPLRIHDYVVLRRQMQLCGVDEGGWVTAPGVTTNTERRNA